MAALATSLVDHVLPQAPVRQWVLTLPFRLPYLIANDLDLTTTVLGLFLDTLFAWIKARTGAPGGQTGAVIHIQRFGGGPQPQPALPFPRPA